MKEGPSTATQLVALAALAKVAFFRDTERGKCWATVRVGDHLEHVPIRSRAFRAWLSKLFYTEHTRVPGSQAIQDALNVLEGDAQYGPDVHPVHVRVAGDDDEIFLDLANAAWSAIRITRDGWTLCPNPPVRFRRGAGMLPLPMPTAGGILDGLRHFVRVPRDQWPLILGWLVMALRPRGPYPVLMFLGEQGSAKTMAQEFLRALIDPNTAAMRTMPRDEQNVAVAARHSWACAFDNVSHLPPWISDALCRLTTGSGFSTRELYSDDDEVIFSAERPLLLNGIDLGALRGDLLDRAVLIELPRIPEDQRQDADTLRTAFHDAWPAFLGALLDAVVVAMRRRPTIDLPALPRMADFAKWATAAEPAFGLAPGTFLQVYANNRAAAHDAVLDASLLAPAVRELIARHGSWTSTPTDLLDALAGLVPERVRQSRDWPGPRSIAGHLRRLAPNLRAVGLDVEFSRGPRPTRTRLITLTRTDAQNIVHNVHNVHSQSPSALPADDPADDVDRDGRRIVRPIVRPNPAENQPVDDVDDVDDKKHHRSAYQEGLKL